MIAKLGFSNLILSISNLLAITILTRTLVVGELEIYLRVIAFFALSNGLINGYINYSLTSELRHGTPWMLLLKRVTPQILLVIIVNSVVALLFLGFVPSLLGACYTICLVLRTFGMGILIAQERRIVLGYLVAAFGQLVICAFLLIVNIHLWQTVILLLITSYIVSDVIIFLLTRKEIKREVSVSSITTTNKLFFQNMSMFFAFSGFSVIDAMFYSQMSENLFVEISLVHRFGIAFVTVVLNPIAIRFVFKLIDQGSAIKLAIRNLMRLLLVLATVFFTIILILWLNQRNFIFIPMFIFKFSEDASLSFITTAIYYLPGLLFMSLSTVCYRVVAAYNLFSVLVVFSGVTWPLSYAAALYVIPLDIDLRFPFAFFITWLSTFTMLIYSLLKSKKI